MSQLPSIIGNTIGNLVAGAVIGKPQTMAERLAKQGYKLLGQVADSGAIRSDAPSPVEQMSEMVEFEGATRVPGGDGEIIATGKHGFFGRIHKDLDWVDQLFTGGSGSSWGGSFVENAGRLGQYQMQLAAAENPAPGMQTVWRAGISTAFTVSDINPAWGSYHYVDGDRPVFIPGDRYNDPGASFLATRPVSYFEIGSYVAALVPLTGGVSRLTGGSLRVEAALARGGAAAERVAPRALEGGVAHEAERLAQLGIPKNNVVWRPGQADFDSAAFKVIVGEPKFTPGGLPKGTIFDGTLGGNMEIKGGSSILDSSYQLRLETYRSLKTNTPLTIDTTRPVNPTFQSWLDRWGVSVVAPK